MSSSCGERACTFTVVDAGSFDRVNFPTVLGPPGTPVYDRPTPPAVLLTDGRVLVSGGGHDLTQSALFNPRSDTWTLTGSLNVGRTRFGATLLPDGRVLVVGGAKTNQTPTSSAEIYDPSTGRSTPTGSMKDALLDVTATLLTNGRVGISASNSEFSDEYDPATGTFSGVAPPADVRLFNPGSWFTVLLDGRILLRKDTTPRCFSAGCGTRQVPMFSGFFYTPSFSNGSWTLGPATPNSAAFSGPGVVMADGRVLVSGRYLYDPATDSMLPVPGTDVLVLLQDGRVLEQTGIYRRNELTIRDESGAQVGAAVPVTLQPRQQLARFVNELFGQEMRGTFRGSLRVQGASAFGVLGLRSPEFSSARCLRELR